MSTVTKRPAPSSSSSSSSSANQPPQPHHQAEDEEGLALLYKALLPGRRWTKETFPRFFDVIYWLRQILALVIGIVYGRAGSRGASAIVSFVGLEVILPRMYYQRYCGVSEDEWDPFDLIKEGFQGAVGVFFTAWVLTFTVCHGSKMAGAGAAEGAGAA